MLKSARGFRDQRCPGCQLPLSLCICCSLPRITAKATFWILMHPFEYDKPTNTGRIIQDCIHQSKIIFWERTLPSHRLLNLIKDNQQVFLVFPEEYKTNTNSPVHSRPLATENPNFILLDGTWKQARKIFRKSPYLHHLPILSLNSEQKSIYKLRRPSQDHHFCTVEVAIALLQQNQEIEQSLKLNLYFKKFVSQHMIHRNGKRFMEKMA
ncbi:MAG: DTW domain-containing protein [Deltaproteobacteria bacterium]|jgi:DTW domain-containing protein|nr:DTW domain-containing protein [Deltaproteobacteria bacterium]